MTEKKSMEKYPQLRKSVIVSVIASIIVIICIQPILRFVWFAILTFGSRFMRSYINSIYASAALGHRNYIDVLLLMALFSLLSGIMISILIQITLFKIRRSLKPERHPDKTGKLHFVFVLLQVLIFHIIAVFFVVGPIADLQLNTSFQQRLKVLAPKLTDLELKEYEAAWASMEKREDYEAIKMKMENIAEIHGITLPKALWK